MSKRGQQFTSSSSGNGIDWTSHHLIENPELNQNGEIVEIGFSYMRFGAVGANPVGGSASLDSFELIVVPEPTSVMALGILMFVPLRRCRRR
jgi:hypothetical protein